MLDWISPELLSFFVFVGLVISAAAFGGQWRAGRWYQLLDKPSWTPPNWLFPIAWTIIYFMIAMAGWQIWETPHAGTLLPLVVWGIQLLLNTAWSYIFFARKQIGLALADIVALWLSIAAFIILAWDINRAAAWLFVPYMVWVSYAAALNATILTRNPVHSRRSNV
ncbi:MAG: tryptophan-rich sensory protein [Hyphomicrobiales bacterium]|nr:tryptophan-rich sensory protein [Hyphomicrobiales bacterium]